MQPLRVEGAQQIIWPLWLMSGASCYWGRCSFFFTHMMSWIWQLTTFCMGQFVWVWQRYRLYLPGSQQNTILAGVHNRQEGSYNQGGWNLFQPPCYNLWSGWSLWTVCIVRALPFGYNCWGACDRHHYSVWPVRHVALQISLDLPCWLAYLPQDSHPALSGSSLPLLCVQLSLFTPHQIR